MRTRIGGGTPVRGKWLFLVAFTFSCFLFWWLRSILARFVFQIHDPVDDSTIVISVLALICFAVGFLFPMRPRPGPRFSDATLDACGGFAYKVTFFLFLPALFISILLSYAGAGSKAQGWSGNIPGPFQGVMYTHLFVGFMFLGTAQPEKHGFRRVWTAAILLLLPRLIISLHGGRFYLAQAVVPALLIAISRGWIRFSLKRLIQISAIALFIIFVPAMTRGDKLLGPDNESTLFMGSNILGLFQDNLDLSLNDDCPPLVISLTAKVIPYSAMGICVIDLGGLKNLPATLERILTYNDAGSYQGLASGTGSNYHLELYVTGGLPAVYIGSVLLGFSCRLFTKWIGMRSLFSGIWVECLTRALFTPRGNLGYVYERIPSLVLATLFVVFIVWAVRLLTREFVSNPAGIVPV
jgi:O-antigen polysaccharide polymerase Wzy